MTVGVIGGGAAGFFTAINMAEKCPEAQVIILEKSGKVLQKVKVSGGGRCNVTNGRPLPADLTAFYPRGGKKLYRPLQTFGTIEMRHWLRERGVETTVEDDLRTFPSSNSSQTIIDCFVDRCNDLRITIQKNTGVTGLTFDQRWHVHTVGDTFAFDKVVIATGSSEQAWGWLKELGLALAPRVPSLFTFNIKDPRIKDLQGMSFPATSVKIATTKLQESGPLLITHWGLSGPAILKLSAVGARELAKKAYRFEIITSFIRESSDDFRNWLKSSATAYPKKHVGNLKVPGCPQRYWTRLLAFLELNDRMPLNQLSKKAINQLTEEMTQARFAVTGKSTFKEEFVTCGGVLLNEIDLETMECKKHPGLYLAGEVLDIDALTGGFNFQGCWTAGWLISEHIKTL